MAEEENNNFAKWLLHNCSSYSYIADIKTGLYHNIKCNDLSTILMENAQGCGKNPEKSGFHACPKCLPQRVAEHSLKNKSRRPSNIIKTKAEIIKEQLKAICESYGIYVDFSGSMAFVTTIAGEWYFDFCDRPIRIHHLNSDQRLDSGGDLVSYSHVQKNTFTSPAHAIAYIFHHEQAAIKRLMSTENN